MARALHTLGMRTSINHLFSLLVTLLCVLVSACGGGSSGGSDGVLAADPVADIAREQGWDELPVKILDVGYLAEPGMLDGVCVIGIQAPSALELAGTIWPDQAPVFGHIGDSFARCLAGTVQVMSSLPGHFGVFLDQLVRVDYDAQAEDCGQQIVGGCYLEWASLVVVLPDRLLGLISLTASYEELESVVVGHEIWHMVAGDFHS